MPRSRLILALALWAAVVGGTAARDPIPRPNILFILSDDQRWDTIRALGNPEIQTPNLDRLVARGFHFTNAYCMGSMVGAVCAPSRTMLMTGRSLWRIPDPAAKQVPPDTPILPKLLRQAGYATFHCGKRGNSCRFANAEFETNIETTNDDDPREMEQAADKAIEFIRSRGAAKEDARPFFLYLAPQVPHDPRQAPDQYMKLYDPASLSLPKNFLPEHPFDNGELDVRDEKLAPRPRDPAQMRRHLADYYACVTYLDAQVGRVIAAIEQTGLAKNTVIIFSSDQGLAVGGCHGLMGKQNLYEEIKPPLVIAGPGIPRGKSAALAYLFDLFPTICDLAGAPIPSRVEGRSLLPIVQGETKAVRDSLFGAYRGCQRMIRDERWKLIRYNAGGARHAQLFDLRADPWETENLAAKTQYAPEVARLESLLSAARRDFGDPLAAEFGEN